MNVSVVREDLTKSSNRTIERVFEKWIPWISSQYFLFSFSIFNVKFWPLDVCAMFNFNEDDVSSIKMQYYWICAFCNKWTMFKRKKHIRLQAKNCNRCFECIRSNLSTFRNAKPFVTVWI